MSDPANPVYTIERGNAARHRDAVLALWRANLKQDPAREGKFEWFYGDGSPSGGAAFHLLRHVPSGAWVGTAAIGRRHMRYQGREIRAGVLADMAVDARHRSLGPAVMLQMRLLEAAAGEFDLLYGFPSPAATPVVKRLGYSVLAQLPRFARVLRHRKYLDRRWPYLPVRFIGWLIDSVRRLLDVAWRFPGAAPRATWSDSTDPRMDTLWRQSMPVDTLMAPRTAALLQWRFDRFPGSRTRYLLLADPRDDSLLAWFACQSSGADLHVRDFWSADAATGIGRHYIAALVRAARAEGHASIDIEYASPSHKRAGWIAQGFVDRGHRLVVGRWLGDQATQALPGDFHFTAADEDV